MPPNGLKPLSTVSTKYTKAESLAEGPLVQSWVFGFSPVLNPGTTITLPNLVQITGSQIDVKISSSNRIAQWTQICAIKITFEYGNFDAVNGAFYVYVPSTSEFFEFMAPVNETPLEGSLVLNAMLPINANGNADIQLIRQCDVPPASPTGYGVISLYNTKQVPYISFNV